MRPRFPLSLLLIAIIWLSNTATTYASHILGGELLYEYTGNLARPNEYKVTARLYQEYLQTNIESTRPTLTVTKGNCSINAERFSTELTRISRITTSPLGCTGDFSYLITVFEGTVQLPPGVWTLSLNEENRSFGMRNIERSEDRGFHIESFLDNTSQLVNNSPKFTSFTLPYLCASQPHRYSFTAFDVDGDSLAYQSVQPQAGNGQQTFCGFPIPYTSYEAGVLQDPVSGQTVNYPARTYSPENPLFSFQIGNGVATPFFQLNAATGELEAFPVISKVGPYVVAVRVNEFRKLNGSWVKIGSVTRDVIYSVFVGSGNRNPRVSGLRVGNGQSAQALDQPIRVAAGQTVSVTLNATDPDAGQTVRFSSDAASVVPGASFQTTGATQGLLTWEVPATLKAGRYSFNVTVADNGCPLNGTEVRTITFLVGSPTLAAKAAQPHILTAFPLPFHDQVQFQLEARRTQAVVVTDELGREVAHLTSRPDGLVVWQPTATVPAGLYFARSIDGRQVARLLRSAAQ
ncbi:putative Ig domain-containing protein [Hymenobacter cellulosivorans]|uniref:Ig domain-containing protein n=1 Tax=Hymenobacter cellulosivorans TaxID=2932249 RepID=A0ABY4FA96_9BACT|nr:putative Ig domain-containing protein [Hymenobacter cellulosivorans]UOQ53022.1 putative Ig domain-containing protein [Hymenobacter cellulosivorans]